MLYGCSYKLPLRNILVIALCEYVEADVKWPYIKESLTSYQ